MTSSRCRLGHSPGLRPSSCARLSSNHRPRPEAPAGARSRQVGWFLPCGGKGPVLREKRSVSAGKKFQPCGKKLAAEPPSRRPLRSFPRKNLSPVISWIVMLAALADSSDICSLRLLIQASLKNQRRSDTRAHAWAASPRSRMGSVPVEPELSSKLITA